MATVKSEAYDHGFLAFKRGQFLKDNPYGKGGLAYVNWRTGWRDARYLERKSQS